MNMCKINDGRRKISGTSSRRNQTCNRANQSSNDMNKIGRACWLSGTGTQRYSICMHWHCKQTSLSPHQKTTMRVRARKPSTSGYCAGGNLDCPRIKWTCCKRARSWKSKRRGTPSGQKEQWRREQRRAAIPRRGKQTVSEREQQQLEGFRPRVRIQARTHFRTGVHDGAHRGSWWLTPSGHFETKEDE